MTRQSQADGTTTVNSVDWDMTCTPAQQWGWGPLVGWRDGWPEGGGDNRICQQVHTRCMKLLTLTHQGEAWHCMEPSHCYVSYVVLLQYTATETIILHMHIVEPLRPLLQSLLYLLYSSISLMLNINQPVLSTCLQYKIASSSSLEHVPEMKHSPDNIALLLFVASKLSLCCSYA